MTYQMKPLGCDPQRIEGMSEKLIVSHYENNYGGAVKRLNLIEEQLAGIDFNTAPGYLINGLKREQLIATKRRTAPFRNRTSFRSCAADRARPTTVACRVARRT